MSEKPVSEPERPLYEDYQLLEWTLDVLKSHGINKRPDMIWRMEQAAKRLRDDARALMTQPAEPRFTLEEILPRVEMACRSYIDDEKNAIVQRVVRDSLTRLQESRR